MLKMTYTIEIIPKGDLACDQFMRQIVIFLF